MTESGNSSGNVSTAGPGPDDVSASENAHSGMRLLIVVIALAGVVPIALIVQWSDLLVGGTMMAGPFPPLAACLLWSLLLALQRVLRRPGKPPLFTRTELLVLLAVWIAANMVAGRGLLHPLLSSLAGTAYYARSGAIAKAIPHDLPDWLAVTNKAAARGYFEGHGETVPWEIWRRPLITWAAFLVPFLVANVCLCALFERIWVRHEKLSFPLVALPLEAVSPTGCAAGPVHRRTIAIGMSVPILLHGFGVAHAYLPGVPSVSFYNDLSTAVTAAPWTALKPLYLNFYPLLIGLTFLAPTDVTLSVWFFLLLNKLEMVVAGAAGWNDGSAGGGMASSPPYLEEQSAGAYLALFATLVWNARSHLVQIFAAAFGMARLGVTLPTGSGGSKERSRSTHDDYRQYRLPAWGLVLGVAGILLWCSSTAMPIWFAACFFGFYFAVALVLSRLMAEGGVSWILAPILPDKLIFGLVGSASLPPVTITRLALHVQHLRDTRQMIGPAIMETGKLRDEAGPSIRYFYLLLLAGMAVALIVGTCAALPILYGHGALSLMPNSDGLQMSAGVVPLTGVNQASARLLHPVVASPASVGGMAAGAAVTLALSLLRLRVSWWPLHPLGYALTGTMQLGYANKMLCSIFLGWMFKAVTLRFGGARGYRYLRGAALGLILGDLLMGGILKLLDALLGPSGYAIF